MPPGDLIFQRLNEATDAERAAMAAALNETLIGELSADIALLSKELRADAASSFIKPWRGDHDLLYRSILEDVVSSAADAADWEAPTIDPAASELWLESYILHAFAFAHRKDKATEAEKKTAREAAEHAIVGKTTPKESSGFARFAGSAAASLFRAHPAVAAAGVVAIGGALLVGWVASGAMRRVVPAVMVLIYVRMRQEAEQGLEDPS
jgi:hypothetical protein